MPQAHVLLLLISPVLLAVAAVGGHLEHRSQPRWTARASTLATHASLALSLLAALHVALRGPAVSPLLGLDGIGVSLRLDAVSATMFALIAFIGVVVVRFSRRYLAGDPRHALFLARLCTTLAAVLLLVLAGNLVHLALAWIATSLTLHRLLVFYPERRRARTAAFKKFWVARLGDVCLVAASVLLVHAFGTTDLGALNEAARALAGSAEVPASIGVAAALLAAAAMLKSAQFPTHGWLVEVMETPTPVSALLHAGIVNAGGFLIVRLADVVALSAGSLYVLAGVGALTALYGSAVMLSQPAVKTALAYSTVAQMGFMLFECGIGAFSIALLHIVAHSLYKAHAFLSAGSAIDAVAQRPMPAAGPARALQRAVLVAGGLTVALGLFATVALGSRPEAVTVALGAIVVLGATHVTARSLAAGPRPAVLLKAFSLAALVLGAYLALETSVQWLYAPALPAIAAPDGPTLTILVLTVTAFACLAGLQLALQHTRAPWLQAAYVHLRHGLYANVLFDRLARALKLPSTSRDSLTPETQP